MSEEHVDRCPHDQHNGIGCCNPILNGHSINSSVCDDNSSTTGSQLNNNNLSHGYNHEDFKVDFPRRDEVDIEFQDIKYTVKRFSMAEKKFVTKEILHGVSGAFRSGEVTAIMGPSGAGKSTLLNIMSGYRTTGVSGTIQVNEKVISPNSDRYLGLSRYIHQHDLHRPNLTVYETMITVAHLKLGFKVSHEYKDNLCKKILMLLGLDKRCNVYAGRLSGGQKKRLSIALELISNPPVLFLDEPTTGLDSSTCGQVVSLLKRLALEGHTIVCTIHQPSALVFEMFDKLYMVAEGNCIYQGPIKELVPFLTELDLHCPRDHNPADYIVEVAIGEHNADLSRMAHVASKKYYEDYDAHRLTNLNADNVIHASMELPRNNRGAVDFDPYGNSGKYLMEIIEHEKYKNVTEGDCEINGILDKMHITPAPLWMQFFLLLKRNFICSTRNYFILLARIISHVFIAVVFGYLYSNVGQLATTVLANYVYIYGTVLLLVYTGKMAVVMSFPTEMDMLIREHFNRWYKLGPYFLSIISFEIPFQIFCAGLYVVISFYLTGNFAPDQAFRFFYFLLMVCLATLSAQAWGFFVGATLPVKIAVFVGPVLAVLFSVFGFCTRYIDITPMLAWMWHISYFRAAFHGVLNAVYGMNRPFLVCPEGVLYCHFRPPKVFLAEMMISDVSMTSSITLMGSVIVIMHILTVLTLWYKLTKR